MKMSFLFALGSGCCLALGHNGAGAAPATSKPPVEEAGNITALAMPAWKPGILDIHHINTGRGNAAFFVFPDGTTMLVDAGALEDDWDRKYRPLTLAPAVPDNSRRPGEWIADYIAQYGPRGMKALDYAVISHFHPDHFGRVQEGSPKARLGSWKLTGLTDVAERWPVRMMIDRGYPDYSFPVSLRGRSDPSTENYFRFVDENVAAGRMRAARLAVGRDDQIVMKRGKSSYPSFSVRNVASNGVAWTGNGTSAKALFDAETITDKRGAFNENPLSIVLKVNYGKFDYVTGGDLTGVNEPDEAEWFNVESKVAPAVGEVDVMTLNHHGNRDATNADWLRTLRPRVLVQQTWVSDHPGGEVVARMGSRKLWPGDRDIFATHIHEETKVAIGPWLTRNYKSMSGHVVVRVNQGGDTYDVFVLDDKDAKRGIVARYGPYQSRGDRPH